MKRQEVIDKLKAGEEIIYSTGYQPTAHFTLGETVRLKTLFNLQKEGLVETRESEKSYGLFYITWKREIK
ncbi:hypothetical protein LCGC14_1974230 [marine sediment metagenome]|uniref:Uncharacterized protein n=1 Tax=marine sediment metagenome TaxID=412755 RepID=A0A0F9FAU2_9ZZZZ